MDADLIVSIATKALVAMAGDGQSDMFDGMTALLLIITTLKIRAALIRK
jgi:hypothetical protein